MNNSEGSSNIVRWEEGPNRILELSSANTLKISLDDTWEHRKITLQLCFDCEKMIVPMVIGTCEGLGNMKSPKRMNLHLKNYKKNRSEKKRWIYEFLLNCKSLSSQYYYGFIDEKENLIYFERFHDRRLDVGLFNNTLPLQLYSNDKRKLRNYMDRLIVKDKKYRQEFRFFDLNEYISFGMISSNY